MYTVRHLMQAKSDQQAYAVPATETVYYALEVMADKNIGAVLVREKDEIVGIFTERDYVRKVVLQGRSSRDTPIKELMTTEMITVGPSFSLEACMELMQEHYIRHLPVMEEGRLVGMVSMRDVVSAILAHKENRIEFLESYIMGREYRK
jgi:CBS domain-containing protein